jgi:hypothetical protein
VSNYYFDSLPFSSLCFVRWDVRVYDVGLLMAALDYVLDLMDFDSKFCVRRPGRSLRLYVKALVLKEICKVSLRYAEGLSLTCFGVRVPKSTLHYWEMRHRDVVVEVLRTLFRLLSLIEYEYSIIDSTKITDWLRGLHELFINVSVGMPCFQYTPSRRVPRWSLPEAYLRA